MDYLDGGFYHKTEIMIHPPLLSAIMAKNSKYQRLWLNLYQLMSKPDACQSDLEVVITYANIFLRRLLQTLISIFLVIDVRSLCSISQLRSSGISQ
jgi:hypothetical protein